MAISEIETLSAFMETANAQFRIYDLGRKITSINKKEFFAMEAGQQPYPFPIQQKARFAMVFWNKDDQQNKTNPYIWFLQFDLDEQGLIKLQQRDHYIAMVVKELGTRLLDKQQQKSELDNHPYSFTPDQARLAMFNAMLKVDLKQPASQYYEAAEQFFAAQVGTDAWQNLSVQGIADFCARVATHHNEENLAVAIKSLPMPVLSSIASSLEHQSIKLELTKAIAESLTQAIKDNEMDKALALLRSMASSVSETVINQTMVNVLNSDAVKNEATFIVLAGRYWSAFQSPELLNLYFDKLAQNQPHLFAGLFADLVAVPSCRVQVLALIRDPNRSPELAMAFGQMFGQQTVQ